METLVLCFVCLVSLGEVVNGIRSMDDDFTAFRSVNSYAGPVRQKTVIRCKVKAVSRPNIQWFRLVPDNFTCENQSSTLINPEGKFCLETRTRSFVRPKSKYTSKLILRRPQVEDSGMYMCVISSNKTKLALITNVRFHRTEDPPVRVVGYRVYGRGSVEMFINDTWRGINASTWGPPEADVICKHLGYDEGGLSRDIWYWPMRHNLLYLDCPLNSSTLSDCVGFNETNSRRRQGYVFCRSSKAYTKRIKLGGISPSEGRVEVYSHGIWGSVCIKGITEREVSMICRTLGYNYGGEQHRFSYPDPWAAWNIELTVAELQCPENASALEQCTFNKNIMGYKNMHPSPCCDCSKMYEDLAVRCRVKQDEDNPASRVRLAAYGSDRIGRVEVYNEKRRFWVTVKSDSLLEPEAYMFCRMLGFQYGGEPFIAISGYETDYIKSISCPLDAPTIDNCTIDWEGGWRRYKEPGGVKCREEPLKVPQVPFRIGRNNPGEKRLQFYRDGYWGTVCGGHIGTPEASMICSMMGNRFGGKLVQSNRQWSLRGLGPVLLQILDCPLNATDLNQCSYNYPGRGVCTQGATVDIICYDRPQNKSIPIRLDGTSDNRGIMKVFHEDKWRYVIYGRNPYFASVVCRQLGFRNGGDMSPSTECLNGDCDFQGSLSGNSQCTGKELNIGDCNDPYWGNWSTKYEPLIIHCYQGNESPFEVSLTEVRDNGKEGAVIVTKNGRRYFICATVWNEIHARAYCRSAGYSDGTPKYYKQKYYNYYKKDRMIISMYCQRGVEDLRQCYHSGWEDWDWDCFTYPVRAGVSCIP